MEPFIPYLIVCPLVFLAGFVDAIAGGGGLISLPAYMVSGIPVHMAIGTNKLSSGMGTALTTWRYGKSGFIDVKIALPCAALALIGSAIGAQIALLVSEHLFKVLMLFILPVAAIYVLKNKRFGEVKAPFTPIKTALLSSTIAFTIGMYDGFYGPGTGTFLLLLLTAVAHLTLQSAAGITKVINLSTNVAALAVYLLNGKVIIPLGLVAGCFSIMGNYLGTRFFTAKGAKFVRPVIIIVLALFFIKVITDLV